MRKSLYVVLFLTGFLSYSHAATDVGRDQEFAVSDQYQSPFAFTGKLKKVTIRYQ